MVIVIFSMIVPIGNVELYFDGIIAFMNIQRMFYLCYSETAYSYLCLNTIEVQSNNRQDLCPWLTKWCWG